MTMAQAHLIGVDWGTSHLRVFRIGGAGAVLEVRASPAGMGSLAREGFEPALWEALAGWEDVPVVCCGMVGARQGWVEAPYARAPAAPADLAARMIRAPTDRPVWVVPGVAQYAASGDLDDVMRGEEVQIAGVMDGNATGLVICPGTHSKWVDVQGGRITRFRTFMTGELHHLLSQQSILRHSVGESATASAAFLAVVARSLDGESLSSALFSIRVATLGQRMTQADASAALSGLLVGAEIAAARREFAVGPSELVGSPDLCRLYAAALDLAGFGRATLRDAGEATPHGLWRIWTEASRT
jgi:2-dehydro-3-deoxygalactonokinase